jgi:hypothetical protein
VIIAEFRVKLLLRHDRVKTKLINAGAAYFMPPQKSRLFAFSPGNMRFKKSVKYNSSTGINQKL